MPLPWPYHRPVLYVTIGICQCNDISLIFKSTERGKKYRNVFEFCFLTNLKVACSCSFPDVLVLLESAFQNHFKILLLLELDVSCTNQLDLPFKINNAILKS